MGFFLNLNHAKTKCVNGCELFNDKNIFSYWEHNKVTSDERHVLNFLKKKISIKGKKILHVGVGNSYLEENLKDFYKVDGITLSGSEILNAKNKKIKKYKIFFLYKGKKKFNTIKKIIRINNYIINKINTFNKIKIFS